MHIRIGQFNKIPLYVDIPGPLRLLRQSWGKDRTIAYFRSRLVFYDQLKAKYEGSIAIIPQKYVKTTPKFITWFRSYDKIVLQPIFFFLPKLNRLFILWHEYGHFVVSLEGNLGDKSHFDVVDEALVDFYACCKLKLHFNQYIKIEYGLKSIDNKAAHLFFEERYNKLYCSKQLSLDERTQDDYVYEFYRDKNAVIRRYELCFFEVCSGWGMDYQNFFDWNAFLTETGWDNDAERWKYINYKNKPD